jgi:hypothetical protein
VVAAEAVDELIAVVVGGVGEGGHHFRDEGELRGAEHMEKMQRGSEVAGDGKAVLDGVLGAGSEVGGDSDVANGDARIGWQRHLRPPWQMRIAG